MIELSHFDYYFQLFIFMYSFVIRFNKGIFHVIFVQVLNILVVT